MPVPKLIAGGRRFREGRYREQRDLFDRLARAGQKPHTLLVACCDSRVDPAILFDCDPGDLFVVRNVANLVPPCEEGGGYHGTSAAIEYAVTVLGVRNIVVLGHSACGGIQALLNGPPIDAGPMPYVTNWMSLAGEVRERVDAAGPCSGEERGAAGEQLGVRLSLRNLMTFPVIRERVERGALTLHGLHYDLHSGELKHYVPEGKEFVSVARDSSAGDKARE